MGIESAPKLVQKAWGKKVRDARKRLGLSQVAAAALVPCDQSTLSRIETGDYRQMNPEMILRLCRAFDLDPDHAFAWPPAIVDIAGMREGSAA